MRIRPVLFAALSLATLTTLPAHAETAALVAARAQAAVDAGDFPAWWNPDLPEAIRKDVDGKGPRLAEKLNLGDEEKTKKVGALVTEHFARVWAWDQAVKERLNAAWAAWDAARDNSGGKQKDEMKALTAAVEQVDPIYAEFAPQINHFLTSLRSEIGEEKTMELVDVITHSPGAKRTYDAYLAMVPEMKDDEKAVLWDRMDTARVNGLAAWSDGQVAKIFKRYKVLNEFSIDYFGYGYRERYEAWAKQQ